MGNTLLQRTTVFTYTHWNITVLVLTWQRKNNNSALSVVLFLTQLINHNNIKKQFATSMSSIFSNWTVLQDAERYILCHSWMKS